MSKAKMVSTGVTKGLLLVFLATHYSIRMIPVSWKDGHTTRTRSLHAPSQNRSTLCSARRWPVRAHHRLMRTHGVT